MKKIFFLLLLLISLTANAETYYVKNGGSDVAAGTSDATAWATVAKVNATAFNPGDSVLFRCNDYWREYVSFSPPAGTAAGRVYYGSYQTGNKPLFLGSKEENLQTDWTNTSGNIWKNTDAQFNVGYGVGNLIFNNETSTGYKEADSTNLNAQGDWFWNDVTKQVYLYSTINPALYYTDIECALDRVIISLAARDYITLDGLDIRYGGQHGISGSTGNDNITIRNCHISYMGGSEFPDATARYGNGIQFWKGATNIIIEKNVIEQIYDDAITPQYDGADGVYSVSMDIRYNVINYTRVSINIFERAVSSTIAINIYNNTMMNAGLEWSSDGQRPDPTFGARHIRLAGITGTISSFNIKNNIFYEADMTCFYGYGSTPLASFDIDNNLYFNSIGTIAQIEDTPYTTLAAWQTGSSQEANSVAGNPLFSSSTNFYLQATSPARNTGTDVSLTSDIAGITVPQETYPEMGAYEYINLPIPVTGLGWEDHLAKRNFKDDVNFAGRLMIDGIPVTATASELNALVGEGEIISGADTVHLSNRIDSKADASLSNLASVAINTHLLPGTDGAVNLGSATYKFGNIFIDSAKVINWNNGDITATHSDQTLTFAGGDIVFPSTTTIGDVSSTEISYVNGVTSAIQTQLNNKADTAGAIDIGDVAYLFGDTLYSQNPAVYTQRQVDSIVSAINGYAAYRLAFIVDSTAWAPGSGDSILTVTAFIDKHLEIYRGSEGDSLYKLYRKNVGQTYHNGYSFQKATGKIVFTPHFETNEHVIIEATDSTSWTDITATSFFESEYLVVYNAMSVKPGADTAWQQNLMFKRILDTADVDIVYIFANRTNTDAYINWVDPGTFDVTDIVAPTFTKYQGITFNGSTHVVNTNFNASADSASAYFSKNNAGIGVYMRTDVGGNYCPFGARTTEDGYTRMIPNNGSNIMLANLNGPSANSTPNTTTLGMAFITRTSKTVVTNYMNSADCTENDALTSRALIPVDMYIGAYNYGGTPTYYFPGEISAFVLGEGFSIQQIAEITDAIEDYMDYLGKGVIP